MQAHRTDNPRGTSYEISCATDRNAPNVLYLLLELHPAAMIPMTSSDRMASRKKTPDESIEPVQKADRGKKANPVNTIPKISNGASRKSLPSAAVGTMSSF